MYLKRYVIAIFLFIKVNVSVFEIGVYTGYYLLKMNDFVRNDKCESKVLSIDDNAFLNTYKLFLICF